MNTNGVRYTHTRPALIGQRYLGSTSQALRGELYTETYTGTLGPSIRSIAPVRNDQGVIVGMVAVGITQSTLTDEWLDQLPLIASIGLVAIVAALGGLWLIRRRLLRLTGGLAPGELRVMYDHHDAVLHSVKEGLVVIDDGEIALCNDEARRLLAGESGGDVGELDDMPEFLLGTEPLTDVLYVDQGRVLVVNRAPVSTRPGSTVVTIRDRAARVRQAHPPPRPRPPHGARPARCPPSRPLRIRRSGRGSRDALVRAAARRRRSSRVSPRLFSARDLDSDYRTVRVLGSHGAAMSVDDVAHQGKAKPSALCIAAGFRRISSTASPLELVVGHPRTAVGNDDL